MSNVGLETTTEVPQLIKAEGAKTKANTARRLHLINTPCVIQTVVATRRFKIKSLVWNRKLRTPFFRKYCLKISQLTRMEKSQYLVSSLVVLMVFVLTVQTGEGKHAWERPGCHRVGNTRRVEIPDCVAFSITTNACRGYCESFAVPTSWDRIRNNPLQTITSVGQCCNIMETEDVTVRVMCVEGERELTFKSAKTCSCYHCKKD